MKRSEASGRLTFAETAAWAKHVVGMLDRARVLRTAAGGKF